MILAQIHKWTQMHLATELLKLTHTIPSLKNVDRICIVKKILYIPKLQVKDSANSSRVTINKIPSKYSCFTSANSSLFTIQDNKARIFSDSSHVIQSYHTNKKPPQRSIRLISEMGLKSGIALPLMHQNQNIEYLFLNSVDDGFFDSLEKSDWIFISALQAVARTYLLSDQRIESNFLQIKQATSTAEAYDTPRFKELLLAGLKSRSIQIDTVDINLIHPGAFLIPHEWLSQLVITVYEWCVLEKSKKLELQIETSGDEIHFIIQNIQPATLRIEQLNREFQTMDVQITSRTEDSVQLDIKADFLPEEFRTTKYSI